MSSSSLSPEGSASSLSFSPSSATVTCVGSSRRRALSASRRRRASRSRGAPAQVGDAVAQRAEPVPHPVDPAVQLTPGWIDNARLGVLLDQAVHSQHVQVELLAHVPEEVLLRPSREQCGGGSASTHAFGALSRGLPASLCTLRSRTTQHSVPAGGQPWSVRTHTCWAAQKVSVMHERLHGLPLSPSLTWRNNP